MKRRDRVEYVEDVKVVLTGAKFVCTKCRKTKSATKFGMRRMGDGTIRNQSQCSKCRSE